MPTIVPFFAAETLGINQTGSKAFALMEMLREGLPVPDGFVLTVSFFEPWLSELRRGSELTTLREAGPDGLEEAARTLQSAISALAFTPQQSDELDSALRAFRNAHPGSLFAVRSSSPDEDLEGASFAGSYETTLGVTTATLHSAVRHSFASSFDQRVLLYRRQSGFAAELPRIAVIVQQQIDAATAGVAFSLNPLNNCYDEAVINANYGLGESVVAGLVEPDTFTVDKIGRKVIGRQIGAKVSAITLRADGGTATAARVPDGQACIEDDRVLELTDLLVQLEAYYRKPVDIEWAVADGQLYLLQVRPITTYLPLPEEMVTPPGSRKRLYADSTLIEQGVQEPLSVLGTDFLRYVLNAMTGPMGGTADSVEDGAFTAGGRYYMNLSRTLRMRGPFGGLAPGSAGDESVLRTLDAIDLDEYLPEEGSPLEAIGVLSGPLKMLPRMLPIVTALRKPESFLQRYLSALPQHLARMERALDEDLSMDEQATSLTALLDFFFYGYGAPMVLASQIAQARIKKLFEDDPDTVSEHLLNLGASLPGNKTAELGAAMLELAGTEAIQEHTSAQTFLEHLEQRNLDPAFLQQWDAFVAEFGARCPREIDVATLRPRESPAILFDQLKGMASVSDGVGASTDIFEAARTRREEAYDALHRLARKKGKRQARSLDRLYRVWVTLGAYRETPKHYIINIVDMYRQRALRVGDAFVAAGRLEHRDQVFDLAIDDIDRALADDQLDLRALTAERTALIDQIRRSHLVARVIDSRGRIFYPPRKARRPGELAGIPISAGTVTGRVKVLRTADEKRLLPGEILVTRATDPGWTPLFINAGGLILEIGGALQHGAVVAREYGLPCVSGIDQATELLKDGQMVEVDGSSGVVRVLDGELPEHAPLSEAELQEQREMEARREHERAKEKLSQTLMRIVPVVLLPLVTLVAAVAIVVTAQLVSGQSLTQALATVRHLWQVGSPYLIGVTNVIAGSVVLGSLWRNRHRIKGAVRKLWRSLGDRATKRN